MKCPLLPDIWPLNWSITTFCQPTAAIVQYFALLPPAVCLINMKMIIIDNRHTWQQLLNKIVRIQFPIFWSQIFLLEKELVLHSFDMFRYPLIFKFFTWISFITCSASKKIYKLYLGGPFISFKSDSEHSRVNQLLTNYWLKLHQ